MCYEYVPLIIVIISAIRNLEATPKHSYIGLPKSLPMWLNNQVNVDHFLLEEPDVEHDYGAIQPSNRGGGRRALQGHLRVRLRLLEDRHLPLFGC